MTTKRNIIGILDNKLVYSTPTSKKNASKEFVGICEGQNAYK